MKQIKAQGDYPRTFSPAPKFPHDVCGAPFLWHFVTLGAIRHHIWHDSIAETTFILCATKTIVEVESVNRECYALCHIAYVCIIKKPSEDGHVHSRKNGGA